MQASQFSYYSEASYVLKRGKHDLVTGLNSNGERFRKILPDSSSIASYRYSTLGLFIQDDWRIDPRLTLETGIRADFHNRYGTFILPRLSLLYKISAALTSRLGGGMGYKIPTVFNSEVDERDYKNIVLDPGVKAERSIGANWDVNYKKRFGEVVLAVNQSFYFTHINRPLVDRTQAGLVLYYTEDLPVVTKGFETWVQVSYKGLEAYLGYTLADAQKKYDKINPYLELSARDKFASVVSYEFSSRFRACIEAAYTGKQYLRNGNRSPAYLFAAAMVRYDIGAFSFVLNCENLFDYRQNKQEAIVIPPFTNPTFRQLWAPIDGRVANLSVKIKL
jgi:outer membrane receptor for ferrienterochelin and colicins